MSSLSQRGAAALVRRQQLAAGVGVTYTRILTGQTLTLTAVPGLSVFPSTGPPGMVELSARDWLVSVTDLYVDGAESPPTVGDTITSVENGQTITWEVQTPKGSAEKEWRYSSQSRVFYRLHCKRLS